MRRGIAVALAALFSAGIEVATLPVDRGPSADDPHRLYDRQADCAVFEIAGFAASRATWDGPCAGWLASGHGTAMFLDKDGRDEILSANFRDGRVADGSAEIRWTNGAHHAVGVIEGAPGGAGVLTNANGDRFEGSWQNGVLNGICSAAWADGDRYDGEWLDGKAEGHGVQVWADGQKYDGLWHSDLPNGQGTVTRKDGAHFAALFVDGKRQVPSAGVARPLLDGLAGKTLIAVDGSTVTLATQERSLVRTMTAPGGTVRKAIFALLGTGLGTISDAGNPPQIGGFSASLPTASKRIMPTGTPKC